MSGIKFQIKKMLFNNYSITNILKSYSLAFISLNSQMISCILLLCITQLMLGNSVFSGISTGNIVTTITYSFFGLTIMISWYSLILSKYISDCIQDNSYSKVLPSFFSSIIPSTLLSILTSLCLVFFVGLKGEYGVLISIFYSLANIIFLEIVYLSTIKDYNGIIKGFAIGNLLILITLLFLTFIPYKFKLIYIFISFISGLSLTASLLFFYIKKIFPSKDKKIFRWFGYLKKYPSLSFIGLFYSLGIYFVPFFYRFRYGNNFIDGFLTVKLNVDIPFYLAILGLIPSLIYFTVKFETILHKSITNFFELIKSESTYDEINFYIKKMTAKIKLNFVKIVIIQGIITFSMIMAPFIFDYVDAKTFNNYLFFVLICLSLSLTSITYISKVIVLYFDKRIFALYITSIYFISVVIFTLVIDFQSIYLKGFGFALGSLISVLFSFYILTNLSKSLEYHLFSIKNN